MEPIILTQEALDKIKNEIEELKSKRPALVERIERALEHGDLSENFDYHDAKEIQAMNESKIRELGSIAKVAVVTKKNNSGKVSLGSIVEIEVNGNKMTFEIVSFNQADPSSGKISNESPIGEALIGYAAGQEVDVKIPSGIIIYKIITVS